VCTRGCCHRYLVTVSGYDVWAIASSLRLAPEQFIVAVAQEKADGKGFLLDRSEQTYDLALDKAPARTKEKPCVFWLGLPGGIGRCGIYPVRPQVCQTYPAILRDGESVRREDVLCPRPAWRDGTLQQPVWRRRLNEMHVEHDIYRLVAARWNHHVLHTARPELISLTGYYGYVLQFYDRLAPVRERIEPAEWAALCERWAAHLQRGRSPLVDDVPELGSWAWLFHDVVAAASRVIAMERGPWGTAEHGPHLPR
jgi:Fe-S-cluster containining protein